MNEKLEILLNSTKNIASVDVDNYEKLEILNKTSQIMEYDVKNALSATEIFDAEREANDIYRIYGRIEYLSLLNGLQYDTHFQQPQLYDFFLPQTTKSINIFNSFKFYLLKPGTGYTQVISGTTIFWVRYFDVIATPADFDLYKAGYTNNVYGDQVYAFNFNRDFDITAYVDNFGFPATELFLYAEFAPGTQYSSNPMSRTIWDINGNPVKVAFTPPTPPTLNIGSRVYGDLIEYSKSNFLQFQKSPQTYYISTMYWTSPTYNTSDELQWKYNPFIPIRLRYFGSSLNQANTGTTSYAQALSIPYYATSIGNGNYVWKDILPQGYIDPITNLGVDYPFVNKKRYLFSTIILDIVPNLNDPYTLGVFSKINFDLPTILNTKPNSDLNNIGKPCQ